jgi:hypothetical protein
MDLILIKPIILFISVITFKNDKALLESLPKNLRSMVSGLPTDGNLIPIIINL